jgi:predicted DNA-binding protein (MmcQ/YjbR family)
MLTRTQLHDHSLSQTATREDFPFGPDVAVLKVMDKMFAILPVNPPLTISLKCDPVLAKMQRDTYPAVQPGYHLNKRHWNTVTIDGTIPDDEVLEMIVHSYDLVVKKMKKADREIIASLKTEAQDE